MGWCFSIACKQDLESEKMMNFLCPDTLIQSRVCGRAQAQAQVHSFFNLFLRRRGGILIYEMRCLFVAVGLSTKFMMVFFCPHNLINATDYTKKHRGATSGPGAGTCCLGCACMGSNPVSSTNENGRWDDSLHRRCPK